MTGDSFRGIFMNIPVNDTLTKTNTKSVLATFATQNFLCNLSRDASQKKYLRR